MEIGNMKELNDWFENSMDLFEIAKLGYENYNVNFTDGVVQLDLSNGELFGASFTTGTLENPNNSFVEVWRVDKLEDFSVMCDNCSGYEDCHQMEEEEECKQYVECCLESIYEEIWESWEFVENSIKEQAQRVWERSK